MLTNKIKRLLFHSQLISTMHWHKHDRAGWGKSGTRRNELPWDSNIHELFHQKKQRPIPPSALFDNTKHLAAMLISARPTPVTCSWPLTASRPSVSPPTKQCRPQDVALLACSCTTQGHGEPKERPGWGANTGVWGAWDLENRQITGCQALSHDTLVRDKTTFRGLSHPRLRAQCSLMV